MSEFNTAVKYVLSKEGILEESMNDPGGITKYGISLRFLKSIIDPKKYGIPSDVNADTIRDLTLEQVLPIYQGEFWDFAPFEKIYNQENCDFIFDMAVNMGISPAIKCAQRACWAVFKDRNVLVDDGILGTKTITIINMCSGHILPALRSERAGYYRLIVEKNPKEKEYLNGWLNRSYNDAGI